jgi:hypothetical protein
MGHLNNKFGLGEGNSNKKIQGIARGLPGDCQVIARGIVDG